MRFKEFKLNPLTEAILDEVSMSPTSLQRWVEGPDAQGMLMGIEFEMLVPISDVYEELTSQPKGSTEKIPNYAYDRTPRSISDAVDFFKRDHLEANPGFDERQAKELEDNLEQRYEKWKDGRLGQIVEHDDYYAKMLKDHMIEFLGDTYDEEDSDKSFNEAEAELGEEAEYDDVMKRATEIRNKFAKKVMADSNNPEFSELYQTIYSDAFYYVKSVAYRPQSIKNMVAEDRWFQDIDISLRNISQDFDIRWPYWESPNDFSSIDDIDIIKYIGNDFSERLGGIEFEASEGYHSIRNRNSGKWIIETDSSITRTDAFGGRGGSPRRNQELGLEFISPAQPIAKTLEQLKQLIAWAKEWGCQTNTSTGLHINISVPNFSIETLDYIKLALFMGDRYILDQFGRLSNSYCNSAAALIDYQRDITRPVVVVDILDKMRDQLNLKASKLIHDGMTDKYTSINTKEKYVEFRGPGGDYLNKPVEQLVDTSLRLAMALHIACDEQSHKEEYAKKLYKLVAPLNSNNDMVGIFSQFSAGTIDRDQLINRAKNLISDKPMPKSQFDLPWWSIVPARDQSASNVVEIQARNKQEAFKLASAEVDKREWWIKDAWKTALEDESKYGKGSGFVITQMKNPPIGKRRVPRRPNPAASVQRPKQTFNVWIDGYAASHKWTVQAPTLADAIAMLTRAGVGSNWPAGSFRGELATTQRPASQRVYKVWVIREPERNWLVSASDVAFAINSVAAGNDIPAHLLDGEAEDEPW